MRGTAPILSLVLLAAACGGDPKTPHPGAVEAPKPTPTTAPDAPAVRVPEPVPAPEAPARPKVEPPVPPTPPVAPVPAQPPVPPVPPTRPTPPVAPAPPAPPAPVQPPSPAVPPPVVSPPVAPPSQPPAPAPTAVPGPADAPTWTDAFLGSDACKKCHFQEAKAWSKGTMAKSLDALRPTPPEETARFERKRKAGLDPAKDYSADATCLPCHVTGFGAAGGFPAPGSPEASDAARVKRTGSVSCEACHGPAARYAPAKTAALAADTNAKFEPSFLAGLGLTKPGADLCRRCHNERSPTHADDPFRFETDRLKVHPTKK